MVKYAVVSLMALCLNGCGLLYTDVRLPRGYRSATPADVKASPEDKVVTGEACGHSLLFLFAWGNAGYAAAVRNALAGNDGAVLYDVKSDMRAQSVLGLYTTFCTVVTGRAAQSR